VKKCRSCGAEVIWAKTDSGAMAPFDAAESPEGTFSLEEMSPPTAHYVLADERQWRGPLHRSHFATCPDAKAWKKAK